jgi:plastocyanin
MDSINKKINLNGLYMGVKTTTALAFVALLTGTMLSSSATSIITAPATRDINVSQDAFVSVKSSENDIGAKNEERNITLDGVALSFDPKVNPASRITSMLMKISDEKTGFPLTHVDWVIKVRTPEGKEVFKSSTIHSHLGTNGLSYKFLEPGKNTVSVQVASLGPRMLGMDVPSPAHTRIFKSGDPMTGWKTDPAYFFGTRIAEFTIDIPSSRHNAVNSLATDTDNNSNKEQGRHSSNDTSNLSERIINGSEKGIKVKLELSTIPEKIVPGKLATLVLNVKSAGNETLVTHPDALITVSRESDKLLQSAPAGNPLIPINGAFHGHTGEKAITAVFPSPGTYKIDMDVYSIPVSNYKFGHAKASFELNVLDDDGTTTAPNMKSTQITNTTNTTTAIPITKELNQVAILGQDAPFYTPDHITVKTGTTLTFRNHDAVMHTVTGTEDGTNVVSPTPNNSFDTGLLSIGQEKRVSFDKEGTYNYFCAVHPFMRGTVIVSS